MVKQTPHRIYKSNKRHDNHGTAIRKSIKSMTMTPASLYTHGIDLRFDSATFGKRIPLDSF